MAILTHTARHLAECLAALASQTRSPDSVTVSCDTDDPAIGAVLDECWPRVLGIRAASTPLIHTFRPHQGEARINQVRNNALRALDAVIGPADRDFVIVLDGDTVLESRAFEKYAEFAALRYELVIPYRVNLSQARSAPVNAEAIFNRPPAMGSVSALAALTDEDRAALEERHARYVRQLAITRLSPRGLEVIKPHKPKVLGGHHAVTVGRLRAINGYDEQYTGYGYDDDDLSRRLHALDPRPRTAIAVRDIVAWHLWHPTRAPGRPTEAPGYARFCTPELPIHAERGWRNPQPQPSPEVRLVSAPVASGTR